jgi:hypothetical protein
MSSNAVDKARAAAQKAAEDLAALEGAEVEKVAQIEAERRERRLEYDRAFLADWSKLADEVTSNRASTEYDPKTMGFLEGVIQFAAGRAKRTAILYAAQNAETHLGLMASERTVPEPRGYPLDIMGHIERIVQGEAQRRAADFAVELDAKREAFVNGGEA